MTDRVILAVAYTPVAPPLQLRKSVGGFLRYIHYRDQHEKRAEARVAAELKYVAHRDRAAGQGRLFTRDGQIGDAERRELSAFVSRAGRSTRPQLTRDRAGQMVDRRPALYRFVLSPEHAAGLDLQRLTRNAMAQLEQDCKGELRWLGAEHGNTAHPHVHLVVAGFRETAPGHFQGVRLTKPRLQRMKDAVVAELERQRREQQLANDPRDRRPERIAIRAPRRLVASRCRTANVPRLAATRRRGAALGAGRSWSLDWQLDRIAESYRRQAERLARERAWEREDRD